MTTYANIEHNLSFIERRESSAVRQALPDQMVLPGMEDNSKEGANDDTASSCPALVSNALGSDKIYFVR